MEGLGQPWEAQHEASTRGGVQDHLLSPGVAPFAPLPPGPGLPPMGPFSLAPTGAEEGHLASL